MREENRDGEGECYRVNKGVEATYNEKDRELTDLKIAGEPVDRDKIYTIALQGYHFANAKEYLNVTKEEFLEEGPSKVVSTSVQDTLEEYLRTHQNLKPEIEGRLNYY
jgi:5'-nucleotidase / UDP-sugar diphosphatase